MYDVYSVGNRLTLPELDAPLRNPHLPKLTTPLKSVGYNYLN